MTKEELIAALTVLFDLTRTTYDPEAAHLQADGLLLQYINDKRVDDAYYRIEKWYS